MHHPIAAALSLLLGAAIAAQDHPPEAGVLIKAMATPERTAEAKAGLIAMGAPAARPVAAALLDSSGALTARQARLLLDVLRQLGPDAAPALPILTRFRTAAPLLWRASVYDALLCIWPYSQEFWRDPQDFEGEYVVFYRSSAKGSTGRRGILAGINRLRRVRTHGIDPRSVEALVPWTVDGDETLRVFACESLVRLGDEVVDAVPVLADAIHYPFPMGPLPQRQQEYRPLVDALLTIAPEDVATLRAHGYLMLYGEDAATRIRGVRGVAKHGAAAREMCRYLLRALGDRDPKVVLALVEALGELGPAAKDATATLLKLSGHSNRTLRRAATTALGKVRGRL